MSKKFVILSWGGIGDALVCTPSFKALKEKFPGCRITVYYSNRHHREVFRNNPCIDSLRRLTLLSLLLDPLRLYGYFFNRQTGRYYRLYFNYVPTSMLYSKSVKEIAADIFDLRLKDKRVQLFLTEKEHRMAVEMLAPYRNTVIVHVYSRSSRNHHWDMANWAALVRQLPDLTFIQIGNDDEPPIEGALDWRGKTSLREAFALLAHCLSFVGIESVYGHVTNAFLLPGVVLFGDSSPLFWGHDNNINIYKGVSCSPCYDYAYGAPCPFGHECMRRITVEEVRDALIRQVTGRVPSKSLTGQPLPLAKELPQTAS